MPIRKLKEAHLLRLIETEKQTLGALVAQASREVFTCRTLELPHRNNEPNISCIPALEYECRWTLSPKFKLYTYEVLDVPNRSGIRLHPLTFFPQTRGCIGLGDSHKDIDIDGELDLIHSGQTLKRFEEIMGHEDFWLIIRWVK